jgi:hypothetical protein
VIVADGMSLELISWNAGYRKGFGRGGREKTREDPVSGFVDLSGTMNYIL